MNALLNNGLFRRVISVIILLIIWKIVAALIGDETILPSPNNVAESIKYHASAELFHHVYITLLRVFAILPCNVYRVSDWNCHGKKGKIR